MGRFTSVGAAHRSDYIITISFKPTPTSRIRSRISNIPPPPRHRARVRVRQRRNQSGAKYTRLRRRPHRSPRSDRAGRSQHRAHEPSNQLPRPIRTPRLGNTPPRTRPETNQRPHHRQRMHLQHRHPPPPRPDTLSPDHRKPQSRHRRLNQDPARFRIRLLRPDEGGRLRRGRQLSRPLTRRAGQRLCRLGDGCRPACLSRQRAPIESQPPRAERGVRGQGEWAFEAAVAVGTAAEELLSGAILCSVQWE